MEKDSAKIAFICDKIIIGGLYLFGFLFPLFFLPFNANVIEINKQLILVVFSLLLVIAWLGKAIAVGRLELKKSLLNLGIVIFLIFYLVSALLSKNLYQALVGAGGVVGESFFSLLGFIIIFFLLVNNLKNRQQVLNFVFAVILSGIIVGLFGLFQLAGKFLLPWDFARAASFNTVGSVNSLEIFLAALLVLSVALFAESDIGRWRQIFYGAAAIFFLLMTLSMNFSNVWWGLSLATIIIIALGIINRDQMSPYRLILPMVVLAFAVLMLLTNTNVFASWLNTPAEVSPSLSATLEIDKQVLKDNLFFGTGPGSFAYDYGLHRSPTLNQTAFWNVRFATGLSKIFSQPAVLGIFGTIVWLAIVLGFAIYGFLLLVRRRGQNWALALGIFSAWLLLAFLQFLYTTNLTLEFAFWAMLALSFLVLKTLLTKNEAEKEAFSHPEVILFEFKRTSPMASVLSFVFVIVLVLTISALYIGGSYYYADILYQRGLRVILDKNDLDNGSVIISRAVMLNPYNDLYLRTLSQAALLRVNNEFSKPQSVDRDTQIQNLIATAINIAKRSTDLGPLNVDNWVQRAVIYRSVMPYTAGADQWTFDSYTEATRLEPNNPYYYFELGRSYVLTSDLSAQSEDKEKKTKAQEYLTKGEEAFKQSVALKPDYAPSLYQLALVYDREGKSEKAIARMKETQEAYPQDVGVAFQLGLLYYKQADWDLAKAQLERALLLDQNYSNARYFLGIIYDKQGDKAKAVEQFEKIAQLNPGNQDVENILANLKAGKPAVPPSELPIQEKEPQEQPPQPGL
ncbi:MAG: putative tpr repeat protein [Parcubacteria group bacterium LiPW_39]|nr:MAG: putative tpr repeat protein [Parcubacteria group bacterium LiPW_39]